MYDSAKTRSAAVQMKRLAGGLDGEVKPGIRVASAGLDSLHGLTARAMEERLAQLLKAASALSGELEELAGRISAYADMLEQADKELAGKL